MNEQERKIVGHIILRYKDALDMLDYHSVSVWDKRDELEALKKQLAELDTPPAPTVYVNEHIQDANDDLGQVNIDDQKVMQEGEDNDDQGNTGFRGKRTPKR